MMIPIVNCAMKAPHSPDCTIGQSNSRITELEAMVRELTGEIKRAACKLEVVGEGLEEHDENLCQEWANQTRVALANVPKEYGGRKE